MDFEVAVDVVPVDEMQLPEFVAGVVNLIESAGDEFEVVLAFVCGVGIAEAVEVLSDPDGECGCVAEPVVIEGCGGYPHLIEEAVCVEASRVVVDAPLIGSQCEESGGDIDDLLEVGELEGIGAIRHGGRNPAEHFDD